MSVRHALLHDQIKTPSIAICSCIDGLRPVIMKLEATYMNSLPERNGR